MSTEIKSPQYPESVSEGTINMWHKKEGDFVKADELLVDIETDKVVMDIVAPHDGVIKQILKQEGEEVGSMELIGVLERAEGGSAPAETPTAEAAVPAKSADSESGGDQYGPAVRQLLDEHKLDANQITGTGPKGRLLKEDVLAFVANNKSAAPAASAPAPSVSVSASPTGRDEKRVPMTRLRAKIAERLVSAQQNAAMLTTFNEVNMKPIMEMRKNYKEAFEKRHGARLGFMSFFVKATVEALKKFPAVNASIDGNDIVYHNYYDVGVAVSSDRGLVVPILRDADEMNFAEVESGIAEYGAKAQQGKLTLEEMTGGTFTISNGGVFGSLMSTPILNPPQTAIMGMHKIQERPMAVNGKVEILPMMYLALSYDHRLIDGKEAVQFLVAIKDAVEDPAKLLLDL
jgi:2-oxoglutarate dehydrogenase E2 component (dihydrolipoamide succinyltransferase)